MLSLYLHLTPTLVGAAPHGVSPGTSALAGRVNNCTLAVTTSTQKRLHHFRSCFKIQAGHVAKPIFKGLGGETPLCVCEENWEYVVGGTDDDPASPSSRDGEGRIPWQSSG